MKREWLKRLYHRVPRGVVTPYAPDAHFERFLLQFELVSAFTTAKNVLITGDDAAFGARHLFDCRAASVTGLIPSRRVRAFAKRSHAAPPHVTYVAEVDPRAKFDVVVIQGNDAVPARADMIVRYGASRWTGGLAGADNPRGLKPAAPLTFVHPADPSVEVSLTTNDPRWREPRLHVGSGTFALPGWINIDLGAYPGTDFRWNVSRGLPFSGVRFVFAEHFIEHLSYSDAAKFVRACRDVLRDDGVLRLSTPSLDWVWRALYRPHAWSGEEDAHHDCFELNVSFRGWGHQFLYNTAALHALLRNAGFAEITNCAYGASDVEILRGLERHERYGDDPALPDVLVVEARGRRTPADEGRAFIERYERDVSAT